MSSKSKKNREREEKNVETNSSSLNFDNLSSKEDVVDVLNTLLRDKVISMDQINEASKKIAVQKSSNNGCFVKKKKQKKSKDKKKNERVTNYLVRHIALRFHYDGANYCGLAENRNSSTDNSVEKVLFAALEKTRLIDPEEETEEEGFGSGGVGIISEIKGEGDDDNTQEQNIAENRTKNTRNDCKYSRSGRTDKGVSAFGQVIALRVRSAFPVGTMIPSMISDSHSSMDQIKKMQNSDLPNNSITALSCWVPSSQKKASQTKGQHHQDGTSSRDDGSLKKRTISEKNFCQILNNVLPTEIRILGWSPVSNNFSARFSTSSRTYRYFFIQRDLSLSSMQEALNYMVGKHDFRNLCKMNCEEVDNFIRVVNYGKIVKTNMSSEDEELHKNCTRIDEYRRPCYFEIQGQAFLWHQIRCIASILFMVGKGLESPSIVKILLDIKTNPAKPSYPFANELPLVLHKCEYKNLDFGHTVQNLWNGKSFITNAIKTNQ